MDNSFPEGEILTMITVSVAIMLLFAIVFILFFYFSQKKFQAQKLLAQEKEIQHQEQLLFSSIQTQENERKRIARELHDEIGSKLNVINLGLHHLLKSEGIQGTKNEIATELFEVIGSTINNTRDIAHDLLPPTLERFGLEMALEEICENFQKASGLQVLFEVHKNNKPEPEPIIALNLIRIIQELMSNTIKYANATQVAVNLWLKQHEIQLTYQDDGNGFDPKDSNHQKGLGMQNIESRTRMIGATYSLESSIGAGVFFQIKKVHQ